MPLRLPPFQTIGPLTHPRRILYRGIPQQSVLLRTGRRIHCAGCALCTRALKRVRTEDHKYHAIIIKGGVIVLTFASPETLGVDEETCGRIEDGHARRF